MSTERRRASPGESRTTFRVGWHDDYTLECVFDAVVDGAVIEQVDKALRQQLLGRATPWSMLFVGEKIERITADVRTPALAMLSFLRDRRPGVVVGATPNLAARMFGGTLSFALGFKLEVVDSRVEGMRRIADVKRAIR